MRMRESSLKKKLILHIGHHKTGSTSLQLALRAAYNDGELNGRHFHYCRAGRGSTMANHLLAKLVNKPDMGVGSKGGWKEAALEAEEVGSDVFIISSEAFEGVSSVKLSNLLREYFPGYDLSIVQYVRPHLSRMLSAYTQKVKTGQITMSFEKFIEFAMKKRLFIYLPRLAELRESFPNAEFIVRPFVRDHLHSKDVVSDFCVAALKSDSDYLSQYTSKEANLSPSQELLSLITLYSSKLSVDGNGELNTKLESKLFSNMRGRFSDIYPVNGNNKLGFSVESLNQLKDFYADDASSMDDVFFSGEPIFTNALSTTKSIASHVKYDNLVPNSREEAIHMAYRDLMVDIVKASEWYKSNLNS